MATIKVVLPCMKLECGWREWRGRTGIPCAGSKPGCCCKVVGFKSESVHDFGGDFRQRQNNFDSAPCTKTYLPKGNTGLLVQVY